MPESLFSAIAPLFNTDGKHAKGHHKPKDWKAKKQQANRTAKQSRKRNRG